MLCVLTTNMLTLKHLHVVPRAFSPHDFPKPLSFLSYINEGALYKSFSFGHVPEKLDLRRVHPLCAESYAIHCNPFRR